jgi:hypothetical protein
MIAIRRGRLHSAIVRFSALSTSTSGSWQMTARVRLSARFFEVETAGAKSTGAVISHPYRAACLFPPNAGLGQKVF